MRECVCVCCGGCRHIDDGPATPQADPLSCVTRSQTLSVYTSDPSRHTTRPLPTLPQPLPREPVALVGETRGQRLGVNLEVVVPDWLSDLTDCCRPDGRYDRRSEVKGGHKKKESQLTSSSWDPSSVALPPTYLMSCDYSEFESQVTQPQSDRSHTKTRCQSVNSWVRD